jgi:hypothetical protein
MYICSCISEETDQMRLHRNLLTFNKSRVELGLRNTRLGRLLQRIPLFYSGILIYGIFNYTTRNKV